MNVVTVVSIDPGGLFTTRAYETPDGWEIPADWHEIDVQFDGLIPADGPGASKALLEAFESVAPVIGSGSIVDDVRSRGD